MNGDVHITLYHERDTARKSVYSTDSVMFGTVYLDTVSLMQMNNGRIPHTLRLSISAPEGGK